MQGERRSFLPLSLLAACLDHATGRLIDSIDSIQILDPQMPYRKIPQRPKAEPSRPGRFWGGARASLRVATCRYVSGDASVALSSGAPSEGRSGTSAGTVSVSWVAAGRLQKEGIGWGQDGCLAQLHGQDSANEFLNATRFTYNIIQHSYSGTAIPETWEATGGLSETTAEQYKHQQAAAPL